MHSVYCVHIENGRQNYKKIKIESRKNDERRVKGNRKERKNSV